MADLAEIPDSGMVTVDAAQLRAILQERETLFTDFMETVKAQAAIYKMIGIDITQENQQPKLGACLKAVKNAYFDGTPDSLTKAMDTARRNYMKYLHQPTTQNPG